MSRKLKGVGIIDNQNFFYIVLLLTLVTLVYYVMIGKLFYIVIFAIVSVVTYQVNKNYTACMLAALVITWFFKLIRGTTEGFQDKKNEDEKDDEKMKDTEENKSDNVLSPLEGFAEAVVKQDQLLDIANGLQPMMKTLSTFMNKLPEGFLEGAVQRMKQQKG
jgi:hypothetical protein